MKPAVAFLTAFGGAARPDARTFAWFPLVGALLGAVLGGAWWAGNEIWTPAIAAAVVIALDLALTGLLHVDGLADSADGLLPPLPSAERRLEVMADPVTGAFGVAVVAMVLVLRVVTLAGIGAHVLTLVALWCASRTAMAVLATALPYARPGGLAAAFLGDEGRRARTFAVSGGVVAAVALAVIAEGVEGVLAVGGVAVGAAAVAWLAHRRIGGFTGDVLGAACVVGETVGLLVLAARW